MDPLLAYYQACENSGQFDTAKLFALASGLKGEPDEELLDVEKLEHCKEMITKVATCSFYEGYMFLQVVLPALFGHDDNDQAVPEASNAANAAPVAVSSLDVRNRANTPMIRRAALSSVAEGSRLRQRNLASMTNDEYDARAASIQPGLVNSISTFASQRGLGPSAKGALAVDTAGDAMSRVRPNAEQPLYPDSVDPNGLTTPQVSRTALRQHMKSRPQGSLNGNTRVHEVPISPVSPYRDSRSPVPELNLASPSRFTGLDSNSRKYVDDLHSKNGELQKKLVERDRFIERIEQQTEKSRVKLERDLDECKAEISMKRRDIERLKGERNAYLESLKAAEAEVERVGFEQSNATALSAKLKRQLETKTTQVDAANRRVLEHQTEIISLKSNLNVNYQQQEQLSKEHRLLELQHQELMHELSVAKEFKAEADAAHKENTNLNETIETLRLELGDLRVQVQTSTLANADNGASGTDGLRRRLNHKYTSLKDELALNGGSRDLLGVDDIAGDGLDALSSRSRSVPAKKHSSSQTYGTLMSPSETESLRSAAVHQWVSTSLAKCSSEDLVVLSEVWKRIDYCDDSSEGADQLRRELMDVFMAPYKYGLKEAIRSRANATLSRIVDNVAGDYSDKREYQRANNGASSGLVQVIAHGQHATAAIIIYSLVIFCLGIITASYMNISQPLAASLPFSLGNGNGTMATAIKGTDAAGMHQIRQILVVDDSPVGRYYSPSRKRAPRSRIGEIMFYWMETLLWDDNDIQIPT
ncbi:hypothetical protein IWW38_000126 [Coemansia aciculifera]|uniref:Uncharacterized protein n=1 Tax=Coemansia aciculifera TaxID=417176 RepID=A0ACC1MC35_9FUNG|nr:hypothetical protein IWW38_000126 [Coemansia aciculifera]